jgi:hypothetical protein|eukprot:3596787-Prymnesium_polylepis.1
MALPSLAQLWASYGPRTYYTSKRIQIDVWEVGLLNRVLWAAVFFYALWAGIEAGTWAYTYARRRSLAAAVAPHLAPPCADPLASQRALTRCRPNVR